MKRESSSYLSPYSAEKTAYGRLNLKNVQEGEEIVLLALGDVKYEVLAYLDNRKDIEILKLETRYMKKREKGLGLKLLIKRKQNS